MFTIEKNVPVVKSKGPAGKYPWADMESGDSILVPMDDFESDRSTIEDHQRRVSNNAREWIRRNKKGWKVETAREGNAVRVWLIDKDDKDDLSDRQGQALYTALELYGVPEDKIQNVAEQVEELIDNEVYVPEGE